MTVQVLKNAENIKQRNELLSKYAGWISSGLFVLEWGLGLIGKIYGVATGAGGE